MATRKTHDLVSPDRIRPGDVITAGEQDWVVIAADGSASLITLTVSDPACVTRLVRLQAKPSTTIHRRVAA